MGFAFFTTPCLKFAEGGSAWCMAEFFDVVIRDVELYNSGLGTDTSEPVPTVNSHVDSVVDSLTVWSRTHTGFQNPAHAITLSDGNALHDEVSADPPELELLNQHETWTGSQIDRALQEAHFINSRATGQKLPWESGVFATIFDSSDSFLASPLSLCPVPPELDDAQQFDQGVGSLPSMPSNVLKRDRTDNVFAHVVKMKRDVDHLTEVSELWAKALKKWHTVLACTGYAGLVGATVRDMVCDGKELEGTLRDVFGNKSCRTANKRASTMLALFSWLDRKKLQVWPIKPEYVAAYLNESNVGGAGSTKGKTLMEALRFCKYVMRLPELDEIIDDPVLTGRVRRLDAARDTVKQSRPLLLSEVKFIEEFLVSDLNIFDRYIAGCILFAIYSRSRWSDLAFLSDLTLDTTETELGLVGFVEGSTRFQKTSTTALKRAMQMPLVAPIRGVTERLWAVEWFDILKQVQFNLTAKPIGAVCRPPTNGMLGTRHLSSEEIGDFLNHVLGLTGERVVTSHCMKTTTLTWCAKYGLEEPARTLLGHHELQSQSLACYSRGLVGFVEGSTRFQKTSTTALKRAMQMPLVAPIRGVTERLWAVEWFDILKQVQFNLTAKPIGAVCRPPTNGMLGTRHLSSEEIGDFLNHVLGLTGERVVTSHCMKTTTLTWCAKYGLEEPARTLLGHHELQSQSLACYSRDMLSRPLALYESMLLNIRSGSFLPDETRSGRFAQRKGDVASACSEEPMRVRVKVENFPEGLSTQSRSEADHVLGVVDLTESSWSLVGSPVSEQDARQESPARASSDDSSSSSSSSSAQEEPLQQKYALDDEVKDCNEPVYQHKQSRVLHRPNKVAGSLACGRRLGDNYRFLEQGASFKWARCSLCFKGEVITKTDQLAEAMAAIHARRTAQ